MSVVMRILTVKEALFLGDDEKEVSGVYVYLLPKDGSGTSQRRFLSDRLLSEMDYRPAAGDDVYVFENAAGRIVELMKV